MQNSTYQYLLYLHQKQCQWVLSADHMVACNTCNPHHTQSPQSDVQYATQHCHGAAKSFLINNAFSTMIKLSIASLIKHLLAYMAYTGCIAEWMAFAWRHFAHKKTVQEIHSLWSTFNGNVSIFNVHKWHHNYGCKCSRQKSENLRPDNCKKPRQIRGEFAVVIIAIQ